MRRSRLPLRRLATGRRVARAGRDRLPRRAASGTLPRGTRPKDCTVAGHTEDTRASDAGVGNLLGGDGFRGIGMTLVFLAHVFANADPAPTLEAYGWAKQPIARIDLALSTFFVLSGYFISRPFMRSFVLGTRRPSDPPLPRNRALRIVPVFYLIATIVMLRFGLDGSIGPTPDNPTGTPPRRTGGRSSRLHVHAELHRRLGDAADRPGVVAGRRDGVLHRDPDRRAHLLQARQAAEDAAQRARSRRSRSWASSRSSASPCANTPTTASSS